MFAFHTLRDFAAGFRKDRAWRTCCANICEVFWQEYPWACIWAFICRGVDCTSNAIHNSKSWGHLYANYEFPFFERRIKAKCVHCITLSDTFLCMYYKLYNSSFADDPSRKKLGAFLVNTQFQGSVNSSALFLTAAAQNLLCLKIATEMGVIIPSAWVTWFKAAVVPAVVSLLLTPMIMYKIFPPEIKETPEAPQIATKRLESMGPMGRDEKIMLGTMGAAVLLWVCGDAIGVSAVTTAMIGLSGLLLSGVLTWRECLTYPAAWDTLFWFAVLVGMSGQLNSLGVISHFANEVGAQLVAANMGWPQVFLLLNAAYFVLHYMFASQTAHVGALYSAFLAMCLSTGVPGVLAALSLGVMSNLFGSLTHYGSGQGAVYYGAGYLDLKEVFKYGAIMGTFNFILWMLIGSFWWKVVGLF